MKVTEAIKRFIVQELMHEENGNGLRDDESLLERAILDSLGLLNLLAFLEQEYQVTVEDQDIIPENFETIQAISALVAQRMRVQMSR